MFDVLCCLALLTVIVAHVCIAASAIHDICVTRKKLALLRAEIQKLDGASHA